MRKQNQLYTSIKEQTSLPAISDSALTGFCAFLFCVFILNYFAVNITLKICISTIIGLAVCFLIFTVKNKLYAKNLIKNKERKELERILAALEIMPDNRLIALFSIIFDKANIPHKVLPYGIQTANYTYFFDYSFVTDRKTALQKIKQSKTPKTVLFCAKQSDDLLCFYSQKKDDFFIADANFLFSLLKKYQVDFPKIDNTKSLMQRITDYLPNFFTKKRAKKLCLSSAFLLLVSNYCFYPFYYRLSGFILLILAAVCLVISKKKQNSANTPPCDFV